MRKPKGQDFKTEASMGNGRKICVKINERTLEFREQYGRKWYSLSIETMYMMAVKAEVLAEKKQKQKQKPGEKRGKRMVKRGLLTMGDGW